MLNELTFLLGAWFGAHVTATAVAASAGLVASHVDTGEEEADSDRELCSLRLFWDEEDVGESRSEEADEEMPDVFVLLLVLLLLGGGVLGEESARCFESVHDEETSVVGEKFDIFPGFTTDFQTFLLC